MRSRQKKLEEETVKAIVTKKHEHRMVGKKKRNWKETEEKRKKNQYVLKMRERWVAWLIGEMRCEMMK